MKNSDKGIIGVITNNSFLSGITHRKMRNSLLDDFFEIYILNLHGHYLENENVTGIRNVFDITVGVSTLRDKITIHFSEEALTSVLNDFTTLTENEISEKYNTKDSRDWKIALAMNDVKKHLKNSKNTKILYRPFDIRETFYTGTNRGFVGVPQKKAAYNFINKENIGLVFPRFSVSDFTHGFITKHITEYSAGGSRSAAETNIAPLYIYSTGNLLTGNKTQYFDNVSQNIYDYKVGGYQVIEKYLRARKKKILNLDEIGTVEKIIKAIYNTINKMEIIEQLTKLSL